MQFDTAVYGDLEYEFAKKAEDGRVVQQFAKNTNIMVILQNICKKHKYDGGMAKHLQKM